MKVELAEQVVDFVRSCAPEPRKALRAALRALQQEKGNIRPLEGELRGFYRLRVQDFRVIFRYHGAGRTRRIRCEFAERCSIIYEVFQRMVTERTGDP